MQRTGKKISLMINENYLLYFFGGGYYTYNIISGWARDHNYYHIHGRTANEPYDVITPINFRDLISVAGIQGFCASKLYYSTLSNNICYS